MRSLAYVTTTFPTFAWFLENEVLALLDRGVDVRVMTLRGVGKQAHPEHARLLEVTQPVGSVLDLRSWWALIAWLVRRPHVLIPDILRLIWASRRSPYAMAGHLGYLPAAARVADLVRTHGLERIHGAWAHFPASVAYLASRLTGRPFSMAGHAGTDLYRTQAFLASKAAAADFVVTCVAQNAEMLRRLAPRARIECVYHGVDLVRLGNVRRSRDPEPMLLGVGRLAAQKGFDLSIRAMAELRSSGTSARLLLIGDGDERPRLEKLVASLDLSDRVEFAGARPHDDVLAAYSRAWLLVAPSRILPEGLRDGIPNVVIEALAVGLPVVGTRVAGIPEGIEHGVTGILCEPEDPRALARAVVELIRSPDTLDRMGERAQTKARETFDTRRNFERLYALFNGKG